MRDERGMTYLELALVAALVVILAGLAIPYVHHRLQAVKELQLRRALAEMRSAIDRYHEAAQLGEIEPWDLAWNMYPKDLQMLVDGVAVKTAADQPAQKTKFLRKIPVDPTTGLATWSCRGYNDDKDTRNDSCDDLYDVFSTSSDLSADGSTYYRDW